MAQCISFSLIHNVSLLLVQLRQVISYGHGNFKSKTRTPYAFERNIIIIIMSSIANHAVPADLAPSFMLGVCLLHRLVIIKKNFRKRMERQFSNDVHIL